MKYLLSLLLFFICFNAFSQIQVDSSGGLRPLGAYPVTSTKYIKGAQRTVPTLEDRDAIPNYLRDTGMLVYVSTLDSTYQLKNGITNTNWVTFKTGGKGNSKTILDTVETTGNAALDTFRNVFTISLFSGGGRVVNVSTLQKNGSGFLPTYVTAGDSTYIDYDFAPSGQVIYKLTVLDASDLVAGGGSETGGGGSSGGGSGSVDTLYIYHKDTTVIAADTVYYYDSTVVYTDTSGGVSGPVDYNTLLNKPTLSAVAGTGSYADLLNKPSLFNGDYSSLTNKPALSVVAGTGSYADLINKPTLFNGDYNSLLNKPALKPVATSGVYSDLTGRPSFATVAISGLYADLLSKPTLSAVAGTGSYTDLLNKPTLFNGDYNSLINKPTIPAQLNLSYTQGVLVTGSYPNLTAKVDTNWLNNYLVSHAVIKTIGTGSCYNVNTRFGLLSEKDAGEPLAQYVLTQRTADSIGVDIIRHSVNSPLIGVGSTYANLMSLLNSNREVEINLHNTPTDGSRNFTSNSERAAYVTFLDTLFRNTLATNTSDTLIIGGNEEANSGYHVLDTSTNTANQSAARYYNNELKPLDSIAALYGAHFKVANGGATGPVSWYFVWKNLTDSGRTTDATELAKAVFSPGFNVAGMPTNASYAASIKFTQQLIPLIKTSNLEYFNWHIKVITNGTDSSHIDPNIITFGVQAWQNITGKNIITNELSSTSVNPNSTAEVVAQCSKYMDYILMYDGTSRTSSPTFSGGPISLRNTGNSINNIGVTLRNTISTIKR